MLPHFELTSDDRIKVNPLAYFSDADVNAYKIAHGLPEHPLFDKGYKSIGCAPCTTIVAEGEDPRAGRWRGLNKKECGIHFDFNGAIARPAAAMEKEKTLFKDGKFIADPFRAWTEGDDPASVRFTHIPVKVFLANRDAVLANPHPNGLLVAPADQVEDIAADLPRFHSIAIAFPGFTDGRGYSSARLLVERYKYKGEVRAVGDVLDGPDHADAPLRRQRLRSDACGDSQGARDRTPYDCKPVLPAGRCHRGAGGNAAVPASGGGAGEGIETFVLPGVIPAKAGTQA